MITPQRYRDCRALGTLKGMLFTVYNHRLIYGRVKEPAFAASTGALEIALAGPSSSLEDQRAVTYGNVKLKKPVGYF